MNESQRTLLQRAARYTAMATQIPAAVVAGYFLGHWLDQWLGTTWLTVVCLLLAIIGVFVQLIQQVLKDQNPK